MKTLTLNIAIILFTLTVNAQRTHIDSILSENEETMFLSVENKPVEFKVLEEPNTLNVFESEKYIKIGGERLRLWKVYKVLEVKTGIIYSFRKWITSEVVYLTIEFEDVNVWNKKYNVASN